MKGNNFGKSIILLYTAGQFDNKSDITLATQKHLI